MPLIYKLIQVKVKRKTLTSFVTLEDKMFSNKVEYMYLSVYTRKRTVKTSKYIML